MVLKDDVLKLEGPIFVFGASGFVGINLLQEILKYRDDCYGISHNIKYAWRLKLAKIPDRNILYCDITYKNSVEILFEKYKAKTIFNLSAYGAYSKQNNSDLIYQTNFVGTLNILQAAKDIKMYVNAGSSSEYGMNCSSPEEDYLLEPNSHYSVSKISISYLLSYYAKFFSYPCVNLRLFSIYGRWEEPDRLIPKLIESGFDKSYPNLVNKDISRDFVYIDDCVKAFIQAAIKTPETYYGKSINIGSGVKTTIEDLANYSREIFKIEEDPVFGKMPDRKWDLKDWYGNYTLAEKIWGWTPDTNVYDGIKLTAEWNKEFGYDKLLSAFNDPKRVLKISPIIACYKDEQAIPIMYERLVNVFNKIGCAYEIIFVNDCSPDNTQHVLDDLCAKDLNVVAVTHSRNFGSQAAFLSGMGIASGDAVVLMDGDLQDPPEVIEEFYDKWLQNFDVVYGVRSKREASFFMNIYYKLFYRVFKKLSYVNIPVDSGDFSLIDKKVVKQLLALPEKEQFLRGLRAWVGFKQTGVEYFRPERMFGRSTNNVMKNIQWAKKAIFSFSFAPLEFMTMMGALLTTISFIAIIFQIVMKLFFPETPHGVPTIIVLILFFGGVNLFAISIIGEYLIKIFQETKGRPVFIRSKVIHKGKIFTDTDEILTLENYDKSKKEC
jgi:dolichol-phosphate mannosyltransferase